MLAYISEITEISESSLSLRNKYLQLKQVLERSCKDITQSESLQFPSLFSRIVFIAQKHVLPRSLEWQLQNIRVKASFLSHNDNNVVTQAQYERALQSIEVFLAYLRGDVFSVSLPVEEKEEDKKISLDKIRVQVLEIDKANELLICRSNQESDIDIKVRYNVIHTNDPFNQTIDRLWIGTQLNLIDVKVDNEGCYIPKAFVLEPDYLIDASSIAECFQNYGNSHLHYFRRKFEQVPNSHYILMGNLANFFLDELIYAEQPSNLKFEDIFLKSFRYMPFEYSSCKDIVENDAFREFMDKARRHFENIRRVVIHDMHTNGFEVHSSTLEPSFFSEKYGFQGRLDLLQLSDTPNGIDRIIELKSGKPPYPADDPTRIASNHEAQTVVYRLMIQSVFGKDARQIYPTILYSSADRQGENLRLAAPYQQLEKEIINIRNLIVATEHDLYISDGQVVDAVFDDLFNIDNYGRVPQFFVDRLADIQKILHKSSDLERAYFYRYISFISRELYLQKMGDEGYDSSMSTSALWNTSFSERQEALDLVADLEIEEIDDDGRDMKIRFRQQEGANFANFREGEICILYPRDDDNASILTNQILKGTVVEISTKHVLLRFRYKQRNRKFFEQYTYWTVEHDKLDHAYNSMFKSLAAFLSAPNDKKELLLGIRQPLSVLDNVPETELSKEEKQESVIEKALAAEDYFMIVGPPGTGKTSIFARQLIERLYADPSANILVMAYTNRAVDELCAAICSAFDESAEDCQKYIRIGSELSCGEGYRHRLLQHLAHEASNRRELSDQLASTRIFVGTLASIVGKPELFDLKKFDVAIIDEASQILESQIIGLLCEFDKFIMIGDHKQLSTITLQNELKSSVNDELLHAIGLYDCRESLFERLYSVCQSKGWHHAYDTLTYHGRMHEDIASFVNTHFYEGILRNATERQTIPLHFEVYNENDTYQSLIATTRFALLPIYQKNENYLSDKINEAEADEVVRLAKTVYDLYHVNGKEFDPQKTVGIIAPYRNQIALIKHKLGELAIPQLTDVMVDTVERYQGSQRDVIILSFCFNKAYQLRYFSNLNREGLVDRKLNVALTRAREQVFMVGNDRILEQNPIYKKLLTFIR